MASDCWAFAVTVVEVFTNGETPYKGWTLDEVMTRVKEGHRLSKPERMPTNVYLMLQRCWSRRPVDRPLFSAICKQLAQVKEEDDLHVIDVDCENDSDKNRNGNMNDGDPNDNDGAKTVLPALSSNRGRDGTVGSDTRGERGSRAEFDGAQVPAPGVRSGGSHYPTQPIRMQSKAATKSTNWVQRGISAVKLRRSTVAEIEVHGSSYDSARADASGLKADPFTTVLKNLRNAASELRQLPTLRETKTHKVPPSGGGGGGGGGELKVEDYVDLTTQNNDKGDDVVYGSNGVAMADLDDAVSKVDYLEFNKRIVETTADIDLNMLTKIAAQSQSEYARIEQNGLARLNREKAKTMQASDVFLGGSCNPTTWRREIAIPMLEQNNIGYFNPQVESWYPELAEIEREQKEKASVLLFIVDKSTRALASIMEATEFLVRGRVMVLAIMDIPEQGAKIDGQHIAPSELKDLNRASVPNPP